MVTRRKSPPSLTPLELEIMQVLWKNGPGTVQAVQQALRTDPPLAYTTVQTMLNILARKGKARRRLRGRAYEYRAVVSEQKASSGALRDLIDRTFGGSAEQLVMSLVKSRQADPKQIAELLQRLAAEEEGDTRE